MEIVTRAHHLVTLVHQPIAQFVTMDIIYKMEFANHAHFPVAIVNHIPTALIATLGLI